MTLPKLYRVSAAAALLDVTPKTVYRLIACGQLSPIDVDASGKQPRIRISEAELKKFIDSRTHAA